MAGESVDGQSQHRDIQQRYRQAPEGVGHGAALQFALALGHRHHRQGISQSGTQGKAHGLAQAVILDGGEQDAADDRAVEGGCGSL